MEYCDEQTIAGRVYRIEARSADNDGFELAIRADDVDVTVRAPAAELARVGDMVQRAMSGLAQLAIGAELLSPQGQRFKARITADRQRWPKAWTSWSREDDERLLAGHRAGTGVDELAAELGRKPAAIVSRLNRHGVLADEEPPEERGP